MLIKFFKYILTLIFFSNFLYADFSVSYLNEEKNYKTVNEVINKEFTSIPSKYTFGIRKNVWLKVEIKNNTKQKKENFLALSNIHIMEEVHFYTVSNNQVIKVDTKWNKYTNYDTINRLGKTLLYKNKINKNDSLEVFIYIKAKSNIYFELYNGNLNDVLNQINKSSILLLILSGMLLSLSIYYLFLWLLTPYKEYLYYVAFAFTMTIWSFYINGGFAQYLDNFFIGPYVNSFIYLFPVWIMLFFKAVFPKNVIPRIFHLILNSIIFMILLIVVLYFIGLTPLIPHISVSTYGIFFYLLGMIAILSISVTIVVKKIPYSKNFLLAFSMNFICSIVSILFYLGKVPYDIFTFYAVLIGGTIEAILLSILLTAKLREVYIEKEKALQIAREKDLKIKTMNDTLSFISHQWRQPLSQINSAVLVLDSELYEKKDNSIIESKLSEIESMTKYMSNTIDDFKSLYCENNESKDIFYLKDSIKSAISNLEHSLKANLINLDIHLDESLKFFGVQNDIIQILLVILNNARDALVLNNIEKARIFIVLKKVDKNAVIEIEDNANGINKDFIDKIFEPYFTTKKSSGGSGLGLYMARLIIEDKLKGKILVFSENNGSTFQIVLPYNQR